MPKVKALEEYVVEARDDHGRPAIVGRIPTPPAPSPLKALDDKKLPRKRLAERESLKERNRQKLETLFWLPAQLQSAQQAQQEAEANRQPEDERSEDITKQEKGKEEISTSSITQTPTSYVVVQRPQNGLRLLHVYIFLTSIFFLMALLPGFRSWVVEEIVVNVFIQSVSSPLLQWACQVGENLMTACPVLCSIIISLYDLFGFWVIAAAFVWLGYRFWIIGKFIGTTASTAFSSRRSRKD
jgi:hypothetical protein